MYDWAIYYRTSTWFKAILGGNSLTKPPWLRSLKIAQKYMYEPKHQHIVLQQKVLVPLWQATPQHAKVQNSKHMSTLLLTTHFDEMVPVSLSSRSSPALKLPTPARLRRKISVDSIEATTWGNICPKIMAIVNLPPNVPPPGNKGLIGLEGNQ